MKTIVKKSVLKMIPASLLGAAMLGVLGLSVYSPTASAYYLEGKTYPLCVTHPEERCFLVAEMVHNYPWPFFQRMDQGFWAGGHYHHYFHRYYLYEGDHFRTFYYYQ